MSNLVRSLTTWDPDGSGPLNPRVIAGGQFTNSGRVRIAQWDGSAWQGFGTGTNSTVHSLASWDADGDGPGAALLVAGGEFDTAGGVSVARIAAWNGSVWQALGQGLLGNNGQICYALTTWDPDGDGPLGPVLVAGGQFDFAGGLANSNNVNKIAYWDGTSWNSFGPPNTPTTGMSDWVRSLTTWDPDGSGPLAPQVVAGGDFITAGGVTVNRIARWDGSAWQAFGSGFDSGQVHALTVHNGELIAGGSFTTSGGATMQRIARWDGSTWQPFGTGMDFNSNVQSLTTWDPDGAGPTAPQLVAGGLFNNNNPPMLPGNCVARWDGFAWQPFGLGVDLSRQVFALTSWDPDGSGPLARNIVVGGGFTLVNDSLTANRIARYSPAGAAPGITSQPLDDATCDGGTASFAVTAVGDGALSYRWRFNSNLIDTNVNPSAATSTLLLNGVTTSDAGPYDCQVTNACGTTTSDAATLAVCRGDFNCDGSQSVQDIFDFLAAYFGNDPSGDFNNSNSITVQDIFDFLAAYFTPCP
ncbi:MAG: immunoglobulin domain-containing protein [Phycisphaerales bacterium]|nr:immunoglobulin domain-containing protein [Phycisphaerales bacterium]